MTKLMLNNFGIFMTRNNWQRRDQTFDKYFLGFSRHANAV